MLLLGAALGLAPGTAQAQDDSNDPPARVGRIARLDGRVTLQARNSDDEVESPRNWPLTSGDLVSTGNDARAELRVGSTALRLGEHTRLRIVRLDDDAIELHLQRGSLALIAQSDAAARELSVSSPAGRFSPQGEGFFRIDADARPGVTAWRSALAVEQASAGFTLRPGQYAELFAEGGWRLGQPVSDEFARWAMQADEGPGSADSALYSPDMTGAEDLRWYGDWQRSEDWGMVWLPREVAADWAPYREGRWAWVAPWGWTWIDDAPWGFAPFHYGRWVMWRGRWGWLPGEARLRPVYAPALVGWVDQPSLGGGFGRAMAWFPLGPREVFVPTYRSSPRHRELINQPYLRQPVPRDELHRYATGPRRGAEPFYRYAQVETARGVLPRTVFEQARRPVDAVHRRDERDRHEAWSRDSRDWRAGRGRGSENEARGSRDPRDERRDERRDAPVGGAGNTIEAIRINPALRGATGNNTNGAPLPDKGRDRNPPETREGREITPGRDNRGGRDGRDNAGRIEEQRSALPPAAAQPLRRESTAPVVVVPAQQQQQQQQPVPTPAAAAPAPPPQAPPVTITPPRAPGGPGAERGSTPEPGRDGRGAGHRGDDRGGGRGEPRGDLRDSHNKDTPPRGAPTAPGATPAPAGNAGNGGGNVAPAAAPQAARPAQAPAVQPVAPPAAAQPPVKPAVPASAGDPGESRNGHPGAEQRRRRGDELR
jgi:hypothetical protein